MPISTASSRSIERRAMGIIDIDEDQDEEEYEIVNLFEDVNKDHTRSSRSRSIGNYYRASTRKESTLHGTSTSSSTSRSRAQSSSGSEIQRISDLERRLQDAEKRVEVEMRNREMVEREVRDLQSSLYAPVAREERKRKRRSGDDDDLEGYLLQYALEKSRGDTLPHHDDNLDAYMLQFAIEESSHGMCLVSCLLSVTAGS